MGFRHNGWVGAVDEGCGSRGQTLSGRTTRDGQCGSRLGHTGSPFSLRATYLLFVADQTLFDSEFWNGRTSILLRWTRPSLEANFGKNVKSLVTNLLVAMRLPAFGLRLFLVWLQLCVWTQQRVRP